MEDTKIFKKLLQRVLRKGGESADIFHEKREDVRISISSDGKKLPAYGFSEGMALHLSKDQFCGTIHVESSMEDELLKAADILRDSSQANRRLLSIHEKYVGNRSNVAASLGDMECIDAPRLKERFKKKLLDNDFKVIASGIEEIGDQLKECSKDELLFFINASFYRQEVHIYDSSGINVEDEREGAILRIRTSYRNNPSNICSEANFEFSNAKDFKEKMNPYKTAKEMIQKSLTKKESVKAPFGEMPLVLDSGSGGVFFHELVGHLFEADNPLMSSLYKEREKIRLRDSVSIFDDPSMMVRGRYSYDDEGVKGRKKALIQSGKWSSLLHDLRTANWKGASPEGNGRRQSFRDLPLPRMSAIYMGNGELSPEDVIGSVKLGIFASEFGQSVFEESSGDFSIQCTAGNIIKDGRMGTPISGAMILGNSLEVLEAVDLVANDLHFDKTGLSCSKFGQTLPSSVGTPTVRIGLVKVIPQ